MTVEPKPTRIGSHFFLGLVVALVSILGVGGCATNSAPPPQPRAENVTAANFDPKSVQKIAVLVQAPTRHNLPREADRMIEDEFISVILGKGYSVASRSDVDAIAREIKFQQSGMTENDAARIGKMLNVPAVLLVNVTDYAVERTKNAPLTALLLSPKGISFFETRAVVGARLISVEKGEILWLGKHGASTTSTEHQGEGSRVLRYVARVVADSFPERR